jgi:hypothetical protein
VKKSRSIPERGKGKEVLLTLTLKSGTKAQDTFMLKSGAKGNARGKESSRTEMVIFNRKEEEVNHPTKDVRDILSL